MPLSTPPPGFEPGTIRLTAGSATTTPRGIKLLKHTADRDRTRDLRVEAGCVAITPLPQTYNPPYSLLATFGQLNGGNTKFL